jgi:hypothetical protein
MRPSLRAVPVALLAASIAACGDSPTETEDLLTQQESLAVYSQVSVAIAQALANVSYSAPSAGGPSAAPVPFSGSMSYSGSCTAAGNVIVTGSYEGSYDSEATSYTYDYDMTMDFSGCRSSGEGGEITIDGDPNLVVTGSYDWTGTTYHYTYEQHGGISFVTGDGRSGSCGIDYTATIDWDGTTSSVTIVGSFCGVDMSVASTS